MITVPAKYAALLRPGSPIWHPRYGAGIAVDLCGDDATGDDAPFVFEQVGQMRWPKLGLPDEVRAQVELVLSDPTGFTHGGWFLAMVTIATEGAEAWRFGLTRRGWALRDFAGAERLLPPEWFEGIPLDEAHATEAMRAAILRVGGSALLRTDAYAPRPPMGGAS